MKIINTTSAPSAIGPYSQAIKIENFIFTSGQIAINPSTSTVEAKDILEQTHQVCKNLKAVLQASESSLEKVVKTTCFLADMSDFDSFNSVYSLYFLGKPARSCVAVKTLPKNVLVEIECIATI